jgi:O-Antigen ligase
VTASEVAVGGSVPGQLAETVPGPVRFGATVVALVLLTWLPVPAAVVFGARVGWTVAVGMGLAMFLATRKRPISPLISSLIVASAMPVTGLVTSASEYLPVASAGVAVLCRGAVEVARTYGKLAMPSRLVLVTLGAYLAWALLTTIFSINLRLSMTYALGMVAVCAFAFVVAPNALQLESDRRRVLGVIAVMAIVAAVCNYAFWITGPLEILGRPDGDIPPTYLRATGLVVPYQAGVFLAPGAQAMVLVAGLVALIALRPLAHGAAKFLISFAVPLTTFALLVTQSRVGWLMGAVAGAALALMTWWSTRGVNVWALVCSAILGTVFVLVLANAIHWTTPLSRPGEFRRDAVPASEVAADSDNGGLSANGLRQGTASTNSGTATTNRGGTGLSGRLPIWRASVSAIRSRPVFGFGPGTQADAIAPLLTGPYSIYRGLTSHSTWLRTAVEMGLPGLLTLIAVVGTVGMASARRWLVSAHLASDPTFLALGTTAIAFTVGQFFETFLLGGVAFYSLYWTFSLGLLASLAARDRTESSERSHAEPNAIGH